MDLSANLNLLAALDVMLEERSVTRAGERLGLSQSATSAVLKQCRELFGDPLLLRARPLMELTPRARELRAPLRDALERLQQVVAPAGELDPASLEVEFRIGGTDFAAYAIAPGLFAALSQEAPKVRARFVPLPAAETGKELAAGRVDLSIAAMAPRGDDLRWSELFRDGGAVLLRRGHPALARAVNGCICAADYRAYPQVHTAVHRSQGSLIQDVTGDDAAVAKYTVPSHVVAPFVIGESDVLVVGSRLLARTLGPRLGLEVLDAPGVAQTVPVVMSWHRSRHETPSMVWLRSLVQRVAREVLASLE